jgi:hypothetical protein
MKNILIYLLVLVAICTPVRVKAQDISKYNIVWNSQSKTSSESMPLGGGDIGCNVWVENNDVIFYISRSGTFDENNSMLKLGRVRLNLTPNPFSRIFKQELKLKEGYIEISGDNNTRIKLWVEVYKPVIHVEVNSDVKINASAIFETWRIEDHQLSEKERSQAFSFNSAPSDKFPVYTRKDIVIHKKKSLIWYHQNFNKDNVVDKEIIQQHLVAVKDEIWNPLKNLIFGGEMLIEGMTFTKTFDSIYVSNKYRGWVYQSDKPSNKYNIDIVLYTANSPTIKEWQCGLGKQVKNAQTSSKKFNANLQWWSQFWDRSHIYINTRKNSDDDKGWELGRNYNLFRYQLGCNAYGEYPSKFNGGLFVYDPDFVMNDMKGWATPDYRRWGGGSFTAQNQRLLYWPMLKSGDFDMMKPQFDFYNRALGNAILRTKVYYGHGGASFAEQLENFGLPVGHAYEKAWGNNTLRPRSDISSTRVLVNLKGDSIKFIDYGYINNLWVSDHYDTQLEFSKMILDYYQYTGEDIQKYISFIDNSVRFFDENFQYWSLKLNGFPLDTNGKLIMYPGSALETYKNATNSTSTIAGMKTVLTGLLGLPASYGTPELRNYWKSVLDRLPEISLCEKNGHTVIAPAKSWTGKVINTEMPQLYPVFPYRLFGVGMSNLQLAIDTWHYGADIKSQYGLSAWHPDPIYVADLGLTNEAKDLVTQKLSSSKVRFPTFWKSGDWAPDHNWGGVAMIALQEMAMQTVGYKIYLLPAWPKDWDADIKLHAPYNTIVEVVVKNGKITDLKVTPSSRLKDVIVADGF